MYFDADARSSESHVRVLGKKRWNALIKNFDGEYSSDQAIADGSLIKNDLHA